MGLHRVTQVYKAAQGYMGYTGIHKATQDFMELSMHGVHRSYKGLLGLYAQGHTGKHGATQGHIRLHKVTYGHTGLHKATVTWGYIWLHKITEFCPQKFWYSQSKASMYFYFVLHLI